MSFGGGGDVPKPKPLPQPAAQANAATGADTNVRAPSVPSDNISTSAAGLKSKAKTIKTSLLGGA